MTNNFHFVVNVPQDTINANMTHAKMAYNTVSDTVLTSKKSIKTTNN